MGYELTDEEWTAIRSMLPNKPRGVPRVNDVASLMASSGSCDLGRHGATCRRISAHTPLAITASFVGDGLACGAGS
jgi:transposase